MALVGAPPRMELRARMERAGPGARSAPRDAGPAEWGSLAAALPEKDGGRTRPRRAGSEDCEGRAPP